jgi:MULE transposase domain
MNFSKPINNDDTENGELQLMGLSFGTRRELIKGVRSFFSKRGYDVKVRISKKTSVIWGCDGSGFSEDTQDVLMKQRNGTTPSNLMGCPFKIKGKQHDDGSWRIEIINYSHNHKALVDETGHPIFRQLSVEDIRTVEHMSNSGVPPRQILSYLRQIYPNMPVIPGVIYSLRHKIFKERLLGRSHIRSLLEELGKGGFKYDILNEGGHPSHLFFAHPLSVELTQNFPNIFVMDSTYKTYRYKMSFLDIAGLSCFNTSFCSGFAFLKGQSEEDYTWALKMFSKNLGEKQPKVILTNRENALMNAINVVFPECTHLISAWHAEKDIWINCKKYFETQGNWNGFWGSWRRVIYSSTELEYIKRWKELESSYIEKKEAVEYIENIWLPLKEKFVSAWTDEYLHFGNCASSKAESAHVKLKKKLQVSAGKVCEVQSKICHAIESEFSEIKVLPLHILSPNLNMNLL